MRNPSWNLTQFGLSLVTVADAQGLSYYSDKTAARLLSLNEAQLREARRSLLTAGLIVYESPLYQAPRSARGRTRAARSLRLRRLEYHPHHAQTMTRNP